MRICTTYCSASPLREGSEMHEIRLDAFAKIPDGLTENDLITMCGKDISLIPKNFKGLVDTAETDIPMGFRRIRSIHNFEITPEADDIVKMLSIGDQEISKGAFMASSFRDLHSIYRASVKLQRKHVILGMGNTGSVTRIRQNILKNEFTFGYADRPTAPGQFSSDEMERFGDDCVIVGITGNPLDHSLSPKMQNAAIAKSGINGTYLRFDSPDVENIDDVIREYDIRGMNVTIPFKQDVIIHMDSLSQRCKEIGAVNTIINNNGKLHGENTDVVGIMHAVNLVDGDVKGQRALIMGSGGAARAAAFAFREMGCEVSICGRNAGTVERICHDFGVDNDDHTGNKDIVVNCTPIGLVEGEYPADIRGMKKDVKVFDMVYGRETPLTSMADKIGCRIVDGGDMLVGQGAESFRLWFGKEPDMKVMKETIRCTE